jgi:DNA polymerase elongation subunit (family B)
MKTRDIEKIRFTEFKNGSQKKRTKKVIAVDTETDKGKAFLLCSFRDEGSEYVEIESVEDWLEYFFQKDMREYLIVGWNIKYDWNALISWLPEDLLRALAFNDTCVYDGYIFKNFGNKFFRISKGHKNINFYDISQFYAHTSLNEASKKFLGLKKIEEVERDKISLQRFENDIEYHDLLIEYCSRDAELTYRLAVMLFKEFDDSMPDINYSKPISPAYFSGQILKEVLPQNQLYPKEVNEMLLKAYKGGRFETTQKGYFEDIYEYDLRSAYPSAMSSYPFSFKGDWIRTNEYHKNPLYGVYETLVKVEDEDLNSICPLPIQNYQNLLFYPSGVIHAHLIKPEIEFLERNKYEYQILNGYEYIPKDEPKALLKDVIFHYYTEKEKYRESNRMRYQLYKLILNSLYGKTLQLVEDTETEESHDIDSADYYVEPDSGKIHFYNRKAKGFNAGSLFNLYLASYITALTHIKLFEFSKRYEQDVISYATDGIYMLKDLPVMETGLGSWEKARYEHGIFYGNGLYMFDEKERTRGLVKGVFTNPHVGREYEKDDMLRFEYAKPLQLKEAVKQSRLNEFNVFTPIQKRLNLNHDNKRVFTKRMTFETVMKEQFPSYPIDIDEHYEERKGIDSVLRYERETERVIEKELRHSDFYDHSLEDEENMRFLKPTVKDILYRE